MSQKMSKQNIPPVIYNKLLESQEQLTKYLKYVRYKQPVPKIQLPPIQSPSLKIKIPKQSSISHFSKNISQQNLSHNSHSKQSTIHQEYKQVKAHNKRYFALLKQVLTLENSMSKKIIKKTIQYIEQYPTMVFLIQVQNNFGKQKKKLCVNQNFVNTQLNDDMIPLFQKIIQKIQSFKRESQSKKLMQLGHRIQHLQILIDNTKYKVKKNSEQNQKIFRTFEADRIQKYLAMQQNISKAQKNYGGSSQNFIKNRQVFSNINRVYLQIKKASTLSD